MDISTILNYVFVVICILIISIASIQMLHVNYNYKEIFNKQDSMFEDLKSDALNSLINGSGVHNLPSIKIETNNNELKVIQSCESGPLFLGPTGTVSDCVSKCASTNVSLLQVESGEEIFVENVMLGVGSWCILGPPPECNLKTTYVEKTLNGIACKSRYPQLYGGVTGELVIGCNDKRYYNPKNRLYDELNKEFVNPRTIYMDHEEETLPDGSLRFTCKYDGVDSMGNKYVPHVSNRFHPTRNYCAKEIFAAHPDVKFTTTGDCDCGTFTETRVKNKIVDDPKTVCTSNYMEKGAETLNVGIDCFTVNSPVVDLNTPTARPCTADKFVSVGSLSQSIKIPYTVNAWGFHPLASRFSGRPQIIEDYVV